ncbi:B-cell differentiation antigen CD72-like protein [Willisornis vidua]|uniref:B-cell differentiation antigen CD72-like protein n=1 Tax=Willisornis vidua TaxID=1566151 RepID=A0ABQ9DG21_9PASS|nr:B-cell differentiation antigen CD72-like protein [Willisornis vidua]
MCTMVLVKHSITRPLPISSARAGEVLHQWRKAKVTASFKGDRKESSVLSTIGADQGMAQSVVYADLKFAAGPPSTVPDEDDSPYENVLPGPVAATLSPEHSPQRWQIPTGLLAASLILLLLLLVAIVALGTCYWQVTRSLRDSSRDHAAKQGRLSQELSTREQSLKQTEQELAEARAELQRVWREGNISQLELERLSAELGRVKGILGKTEKEMQEVQGKLNNSESTVSSLRACVNTGWVLYRSKCLFISVMSKNWWNSKKDCEEKFARLLAHDDWSSPTVPHFVQESHNKYWIGPFYDKEAAFQQQDSSYIQFCTAVTNGEIRYSSCMARFQWICEKFPKLSSTSETQPLYLAKD